MDNEQQFVIGRLNNEIQIISLNGRLTYDYITEYKNDITKLIQDAEGYIIDLRGLEQIDSTGLGLLVNVAKHFINNKQKMVIVNTNTLIQELFILGLFSLINIIMRQDMASVLDNIPIGDDIVHALLGQHNDLSDVLELVILSEHEEIEKIIKRIEPYHLTLNNMSKFYVEATIWADQITA